MATVHPSRLGLVPRSAPKPPPPAPSREEELRRKLLERRSERTGADDATRDERRHDERDSGKEGDKSGTHGRSRDSDERQHTEDRSGRSSRDRPPSPRNRRELEDVRPRDRGTDRGENGELKDRNRGRERDRSRDRGKDMGRDRGREDPPHIREDRRDNDRNGDRRASPSYKPYDAPPPRPGFGNHDGPFPGMQREGMPPMGAPPPWRDGSGGGWQGPPRGGHGGGGGGGGGGFYGPVDFERRRLEREQNPLSIWPASPKYPHRDEDELAADRKASKRKSKKSKSKKSKRRSKRYSDSDDSSDTDSSEEERRRRRRRKEKERDKAARKRVTPEDSESDGERKRKRRKSLGETDDADQWVEKGGEVVLVPKQEDVAKIISPSEPIVLPPQLDSDDEEVGPHLPVEYTGRDGKIDRTAYTNLLRGEGEAMAAFVASGQRIPRRGEIGLESDQITAFEGMGYVMSGSRHRRMNAVRMRKENQVINAEEERAILKLQREEKAKKEAMIIGQFRDMMADSLKVQGMEKH